jgi:hypothetical protein
VVEHHLAKVGVASSNLVSRSFLLGGVAKWLRRRSAKSLFIGSTPIAASCELCRGGGIGRRKGLKIPRIFISVPVRLRPSALILSCFVEITEAVNKNNRSVAILFMARFFIIQGKIGRLAQVARVLA